MNDKLLELATSYSQTLDEVVTFRKTLIGSYLVLGVKDNKFVYKEFADYEKISKH